MGGWSAGQLTLSTKVARCEYPFTCIHLGGEIGTVQIKWNVKNPTQQPEQKSNSGCSIQSLEL